MSELPFIDLWLLRYDESTLVVSPSWFGEQERSRLAAMRHPRRKLEFLLGRRLLRHALRHRYPEFYASWRVYAPQEGRPILQADQSTALPGFSISHCKQHIACALASFEPIGVDIECVGARKRDIAALSTAVLHPIEQARLSALSPPERESGFFRYWTLKEALAKALGVGLALPMRELAFVDDRLEAAPPFVASSDWRFQTLRDASIQIAMAWKTLAVAAPVLHCVESQNLYVD